MKSKKKHFDPDQFHFVGEKRIEKTSIQLFEYDKDRFVEYPHFNEFERISGFICSSCTNWINVHGLHNSSIISAICLELGAHQMLISDILDTHQRPKVEEYNEHLFFNVRSILQTSEDAIFTEQISFILGENYLASFQERKGDHFEHIRERIRANKGIVRSKRADYLLFLLLDAILENYYTSVDFIESQLENFEKRIQIDSSPELLVGIEKSKEFLLKLKKVITPLKDVVVSLEKGYAKFIMPENVRYFSDLKDSCMYLLDQIEEHFQFMEGMINIYYSVQGYRMNEVMKILTIVATIFIPLTFIAGIYGMNFEVMPELKWKYGYFVILGIMLLIFVLMIRWFKKRKWM